MSEITVLGLGKMGSALARALLNDSWKVTVWNRTESKAKPLIEAGAELADNPASAILTSPVFIVCVLNYDIAQKILSQVEVRESLPGKVMIQLSSGTPREAHESKAWINRHQAEYLDGEIMVYPELIGKPDGEILIAGDETEFKRCEPLLKSLADNITYLGEEIGAPLAYGWAMGSVLWGALLGALHGARICEVEGLAIDQFAQRLNKRDMDTINGAVQDILNRIKEDRYDESQGTLNVAADAAERLLQHAYEAKINTDFPHYAATTLKKGIDAGLGHEDMAAFIKILRGSAENPDGQ